MENRARPVIRGSQVDPAIRRTSDHEDSRRLASGLPADLSGFPRTEAQGSHPGADRPALGRQTDPGDRRTSDWRSSTWEMTLWAGFNLWHLDRSIERDTTGNASRTLMTGLRRPDQRGVTTFDDAESVTANWGTRPHTIGCGQG